MRSIASFILACCWMYFIVPAKVVAQNEEFVSRHYTMRDGLPDEGINSVMQDSHGFLWFGTFSGLSKFDGYKFTNYRNNPISANSLGNNVVGSLCEDKKGRLWIAHPQGLDLFDPKTENFDFHWPDSGQRISVLTIRKRKDGNLWICTNKGIYLADTEALLLQKETRLPGSLWYWDIVETNDSSIWAASTSQLVHLDKKTNQTSIYRHDPKNPKSVSNNFIRKIFVDGKERVWIATNNGINLFNAHDESFTRYATGTIVNDILQTSNGKLIVASHRGLYSLDSKAGLYEEIMGMFFPGSLLKDKQGIIWVSTLKGLKQINPEIKTFVINSQFGNGFASIVEDANHDIWTLTLPDKPSVFRFDPSLKHVFQYENKSKLNLNIPAHPMLKSHIRSLASDDDGSIWLVAPDRVEKYDSKLRFTTIYTGPTTGGEEIITSFIDSKGNIWLGGWNGVEKYNPKTKTREQLKSFPGGYAFTFLEDDHQNLWIGSTKGLTRFNLITNKIDIFKNDPTNPHSLSNNTVFNLMMDTKKIIWLGTAGGLNQMVKGTENDTPHFVNWRTTTSGLPNDDVYCIVESVDGTLWLTCGNIISHFNPKENHFRNYDHRNGLSGNNFRGARYLGGSGLKSYDGQIFFGSRDGLVIFHPDSLQTNSFIPPIVVTSFSINNQSVPLKSSNADTMDLESPLQKLITYTQEVELTYGQNDFTFEFAALNFINPEGNQYKYKLEPYEKRWIETNADNRIARYTNISPGTYTFRVTGSNNDGLWNEEGVSLIIIIAPPWWQTSWAYTLYGLAFISILLVWRKYDIKRVKLKNRAEHLSEVDNLKTRFFANISHEFRTPITLILGPLKEMYQGKFEGDQKSAMGLMMRNGQRLLGLINQLLDLSKIEAGKLKLHTAPTDLVEFLREIASSYESLATEKKIKYFFYPEVEILIAFIDAEKMEKVIHNLLSNAFKFTKSEGEIILYLKADNNQTAIIVKDTGIGIPADQLNKVFDRFYQVDSSQTRTYEGSGLGMALAKELVELHKGKISVSSTEGKGTTFTVIIPLGKEHLNKDEISDSEYHTEAERLSEIVVSAGIEPDANEPLSSALQAVLLIVEDNADMRRYIRKTLSEQYQILEAENGKAGVKLAEESVPDLIISDIMMPEMDGYKLCELIKTNELTSHIPVILLTAKADRESKLAGLQFGADDYLSKPFDADELKLIVRNRIEERRKMRERFSKEITLEPKQISITSLDEKFLTKVLTLIEEHMDDENFSIEELSREAGFSNMHFYRKIKGLSGQTPSQFLRTIRLKRAAELLAKGSDNVTQIAYSVGFSSLSYFNKCFKEQFGVTPGQYAGQDLRFEI